MKVELIKPIGYCYGVIRAINLAKEIRNKHLNKNVYVFGMLVHNQEVVSMLLKDNIKTIDTRNIDVIQKLNEFTTDDVVIFTAHGHKKVYEEILNKNNVLHYDATCPRVEKNIELINNYNGEVIYIGKKNHPETEVCLSLSNKVHLYDINNGLIEGVLNSSPLVLNQTTLSFLEIKEIHDDIKNKYPNAVFYDEICDATKNRQINIQHIDKDCDLLIIVGGKESSNSNKLFEVAKNIHKDKTIYFIENLDELKNKDLSAYQKACIASGTSTPIETINNIKHYLERK